MIVVLVLYRSAKLTYHLHQLGLHHIVMNHGYFATAGWLLWSDNATVRGDVAESLETMNQSVQGLQVDVRSRAGAHTHTPKHKI